MRGKHRGWEEAEESNSLDTLQMPVPPRQGKGGGRQGWGPARLGRGRSNRAQRRDLGKDQMWGTLSLTAPKHHMSQQSSWPIYDLESSYS